MAVATGLVLAWSGIGASIDFAHAGSATKFTDWMGRDTGGATGSLLGRGVTLAGVVTAQSTLDGNHPGWDLDHFTPRLAHSDALEIEGRNGNAYTLTFAAPVQDPVLHLGSLASRIEFPTGTAVTKVSGQASLTVSGSAVAGVASERAQDGTTDANGTVRLTGTFTSLKFTVTPTFSDGSIPDGIYLQLGGSTPPPEPTPEPTPSATASPEPTPAPAPAGGRNVTRPSIEFVDFASDGTRYRCNPGKWEGLPPSPGFSYTWWKEGTVEFNGGDFRERPARVVSRTQIYTLPPADRGQHYYCQVDVRDTTGQMRTACSPSTVLTGKSEHASHVLMPQFFGDYRIRGIDVFQITQPNPGARMFAYPGAPSVPQTSPFPNLCGGGTPTAFLYCDTKPADAQRAGYMGVPFDQRKQTTAIVYVDMNGAAAADASQELEITLRARLGGERLSDTITRRSTNRPVTSTPWVTREERRDSRRFGVVFQVPASWLAVAVQNGDRLDLEASVSLPLAATNRGVRECPNYVGNANCDINNRFRVEGLPVFDDLAALRIRSLPLVVDGQTADTLTDPEYVLRDVIKLFPGGERMEIFPYDASLDINPAATRMLAEDVCAPYRTKKDDAEDFRACRKAGVMDIVNRWLEAPGNQEGYEILMGVHRYLQDPSGQEEPGYAWNGTILTPTKPIITANDHARPITAAAHEFGHAVGLPHADGGSEGDNFGESTGCGGSDGGGSEFWDRTGDGRLQGAAFQRRPRFGDFNNYEVKIDEAPIRNPDGTWTTTEVFDLMSYCAKNREPISWLSPRNWNRSFAAMRTKRELDTARDSQSASTARASRSRSASPMRETERAGDRQLMQSTRVEAIAFGEFGPSGARLTRVVPAAPGSGTPKPAPASPLRLRALDAAGKLLREVPAEVRPLLDSEGVGTFLAAVPAGAASVELVRDGTALHRLERTQPPTIKLTAPRRGTRVGRRALAVRWSATDPDSRDLQATVAYAADGRRFRTVYQGPNRGRAAVPAEFLESGARARVRVTVNDGFNDAAATSAPFQAAGRPPTVQIVLPAAGDQAQAGRVLLTGSARDDHGRRLTGRALTWYAGSRRLGTGERLQADLPAGRTRLRLQARGGGRSATATRMLAVTPPLVQIRTLRVPARVPAGARTASIAIATTTPATLRLEGRTFPVGPRARTLRVPLPARPRAGVVRIPFSLTSAGSSMRETFVVTR